MGCRRKNEHPTTASLDLDRNRSFDDQAASFIAAAIFVET